MCGNDLWNSKKSKRYKLSRWIGLFCMLFAISMTAIACKGPAEEAPGGNGKDEDTINQPSAMPSAEPTVPGGEEDVEPTAPGEAEPTAEPTPSETEVTAVPTATVKPEPTTGPTPTKKPAPTVTPSPDSDFVPSDEVVHSMTAFQQGNYLFYKSGKFTEAFIASKNLKTSKVTKLVDLGEIYLGSSQFYLKGSNLYYHSAEDIYRVGVDGKNKIRLYKGTATILGIHEEDVLALERKTREIIRISKEGEKKTLVKLDSIDSLEAVMAEDGIYYINKSSYYNSKEKSTDRLYHIDFNGKNKIEVYAAQYIYDLKSNGKDLFFIALKEAPEGMELNKIVNYMAETLHSVSGEELEAQGYEWIDSHVFKLLAANSDRVFYGIYPTGIYSVGTNGKDFGLYMDAAKEIEGINGSAYFSRGDMDGNYLKIVFDCDEDPVEVYLIDTGDKSTIQFEGGHYISGSIDVEGEYVYYCKTPKYDRYGDFPEEYEFGQSKLSELK